MIFMPLIKSICGRLADKGGTFSGVNPGCVAHGYDNGKGAVEAFTMRA